jgi:hypothetical protein
MVTTSAAMMPAVEDARQARDELLHAKAQGLRHAQYGGHHGHHMAQGPGHPLVKERREPGADRQGQASTVRAATQRQANNRVGRPGRKAPVCERPDAGVAHVAQVAGLGERLDGGQVFGEVVHRLGGGEGQHANADADANANADADADPNLIENHEKFENSGLSSRNPSFRRPETGQVASARHEMTKKATAYTYQKPNESRVVLLILLRKVLESFGKTMAQRMSAATKSLAVIVTCVVKPR